MATRKPTWKMGGARRSSYPIKRKNLRHFRNQSYTYTVEWTMDRFSGVRFPLIGYELLSESPECDHSRPKSMSLRIRREKQSANPEQSGGARVRPGDYGPQLKDCCKCRHRPVNSANPSKLRSSNSVIWPAGIV